MTGLVQPKRRKGTEMDQEWHDRVDAALMQARKRGPVRRKVKHGPVRRKVKHPHWRAFKRGFSYELNRSHRFMTGRNLDGTPARSRNPYSMYYDAGDDLDYYIIHEMSGR